MGRRKASNIEVQRSQIRPNQTKQNHTTQNCVNSAIVYPGSSQFRHACMDNMKISIIQVENLSVEYNTDHKFESLTVSATF